MWVMITNQLYLTLSSADKCMVNGVYSLSQMKPTKTSIHIKVLVIRFLSSIDNGVSTKISMIEDQIFGYGRSDQDSSATFAKAKL